jgi:hypothetical protein
VTCPVCLRRVKHEAMAVELAFYLTGSPLCEVVHHVSPAVAWDEAGPGTRRRLVELMLRLAVEHRSDAYVRRHYRRAFQVVCNARTRAHVDSLPTRRAAA